MLFAYILMKKRKYVTKWITEIRDLLSVNIVYISYNESLFNALKLLSFHCVDSQYSWINAVAGTFSSTSAGDSCNPLCRFLNISDSIL